MSFSGKSREYVKLRPYEGILWNVSGAIRDYFKLGGLIRDHFKLWPFSDYIKLGPYQRLFQIRVLFGIISN